MYMNLLPNDGFLWKFVIRLLDTKLNKTISCARLDILITSSNRPRKSRARNPLIGSL